jgi:N utilization substance protein B
VRRTRARAWTLQVLYAWESMSPRPALAEAADTVFRTRRVAASRMPLVRRHLELIDANLPEIDRALQGAMENWRLERLSRVDRSVLRLAAAELLFADEVPPKVALQEGVRLAGQYGGNDSHKFVNGVLDAVYRAHPRKAPSA